MLNSICLEREKAKETEIKCVEIEEKDNVHKKLMDLPENTSMYKCRNCNSIFDIFSNVGEGVAILIALNYRNRMLCPECNTDMTELMCKVDAYSLYLKLKGVRCRENTIMSGTDLCPVCNSPICPVCYNHSVISLSRVTGYVQDISGWNSGKIQELQDRKRYNIGL